MITQATDMTLTLRLLKNCILRQSLRMSPKDSKCMKLVDPQDSNIIDLDQVISDDMIDGKEQEACHQHEMHQLLLRDFFNIPVQPEIEDVELNEADLALLAEILDIGTWFGGQPDDLMEDLSPSLDESLDMDNDIEDDL
ncbi:hypothetical protein BON22_4346 [Cyberlindnera fabianii]|uniref:Uncharacterized protein n=1 Tax=Cyberlindnera fabianii TaxID=36022 RepID=A0A1V2L230_CYBFA|nr:hypothetical protein BON22_4346 [Cyberlindnera fabianii]